MLSWAKQRQLMFVASFALLCILAAGGWYALTKPAPTCFDGKQNQNELEIDCGGICSKACSSQVAPITVWWTRVFETAPAYYDAAALVENKNSKFGTGRISYLIRVYDRYNMLLAEREGTTFFNPQEKFVIYEPNINVGAKIPDRAFIYFVGKVDWQRVRAVPAQVSIGEVRYTKTPAPRLEATARNESLDLLRGSKFVAVLSDESGDAIGASQTVIDTLAGGEKRKLNFTWPTPFRSEPVVKDIYPKLNTWTEQ